MPTAKQLLEDFQEMGRRSSLDLKNGWHYEGYVLEVREEYLLFGVGGPEAPDEPVRIPVEEVDFNTLSYWDEERRCYMDASWDDARTTWSHTPHRRPVRIPETRRPWWKFWG